MLFGGVRRKAAGGKTRNEGQISDTNWKQEIKTMKRTVVHLRDWVGCRGSDREGKRKWDFTSYFLDRLNKSIKDRWRTLIELHKWDWGGNTHGKAVTKQSPEWADHSFRHSEINHPCLYPLNLSRFSSFFLSFWCHSHYVKVTFIPTFSQFPQLILIFPYTYNPWKCFRWNLQKPKHTALEYSCLHIVVFVISPRAQPESEVCSHFNQGSCQGRD